MKIRDRAGTDDGKADGVVHIPDVLPSGCAEGQSAKFASPARLDSNGVSHTAFPATQKKSANRVIVTPLVPPSVLTSFASGIPPPAVDTLVKVVESIWRFGEVVRVV